MKKSYPFFIYYQLSVLSCSCRSIWSPSVWSSTMALRRLPQNIYPDPRAATCVFCPMGSVLPVGNGKHLPYALAQWTDTSRRTLVRQFAPFFIHTLTPMDVWIALSPRCMRSSGPWVYDADGKGLHHDGVFLVHRDVTRRENLWWSYALNESYASWDRDLTALKEQLTDERIPVGAVSDWKRGLIAAVIHAFGDIAYQRCLAHVAQHAATLLPKGSPFLATRRLRDIALALRKIKTVTRCAIGNNRSLHGDTSMATC